MSAPAVLPRWRLDCGGERRWTHPLPLDRVQALADLVFPPPAELVLTAVVGGEAWRRQGGEAYDGGGRSPVVWTRLDRPGLSEGRAS